MKFVRARNRTAGLVGLLLGWGAAGGQLNVSSAYTHVAVIVEPREHALLEPVVLNMLQHLSLQWRVQIFHGTANAAFVARAPGLQHGFESGRIVRADLGVENLNLGMYNALLTNASFWRRAKILVSAV